MAKTIAIYTEFPIKGCDVWQEALGVDISMDEAVKRYIHRWEREARQDQKNTKLVYVSIAQIPEVAPENGEEYIYEDSYILPEFWLDEADSKDVVKDGKLVVAE